MACAQRAARILLIEDEPLVRVALAEVLRVAGFCVVEAATADEAAVFLAAGEAIDLIFSDVRMPGSRSGLDLAREVKRASPSLPVILTSGNPVAACAEVADAFIPKPYLDEDVAKVVTEMLSRFPPEETAWPKNASS